MISQPALEESVLALLIHSNEHASLLALKIADATLFTNPTAKIIARAAIEHITKYQTPPKQAIEILLENELKRGEQGKLIRSALDGFISRLEESNPTFVLENLDNFIESQRLTAAFQDSLELLQQGEIEKAKERAYKASSVGVDSSPGLWMRNLNEALSFFNHEENEDFFPSGIGVLDYRGVRPDRKTVMFMIAATGKGKTWWLIEVGKQALLHHKKVLHITLELSREKTARRYMQSIFGLTKKEAQLVSIHTFEKDIDGNTIIKLNELQRDSILSKKKDIQKTLVDWHSCPDWVIKEFPTSTLSVEHLYLYMDGLERQRGFKPDLLIIDYSDLMKIDAQSLRIDTGRLYREIRGLSVSKNIALVSATQGNRESETAKLVGSTNVSEDWSKIGTGDIVITYSQTPEEFRLGLARIFTAKSRDSGDRFLTLISQNYDIGQFCVDSTPMHPDLATLLSSL